MSPSTRLARFVIVGAAGFTVQIVCLQALVATGLHYLVATALAVEAAILHNFIWHAAWTWRDRPTRAADVWGRLLRFNSVSAAASILGSVAIVWALVHGLRVPVVVANAVAVVMVSALNYAGLTRWVFVPTTSRGAVPLTGALVLWALVGPMAPTASAAELSPETLQAWRRYVATTEARVDRELRSPNGFLACDFLGEGERTTVRAAARDGSVVVRNVGGQGGAGIDIPAGTIHHWRGMVFIPGATVDEVLHTVADPTGVRAHRQEDVLEARVLSRSPNGLRLFLKLQRRVIVSATYNTEHDVSYRAHGTGRASSRSVATRISEVVNAGEPDEHERPRGEDRGFLWGLNSYWRYQAVPGGVLVELESLTLSRGVPWGVGAVVRPLVDQVARESMTRTLTALRARFARSPR
jgi:putative flippase GtrA